ncbi:HD domain-containing phosphohydrolase [Flavobacterium sp.]|jgi:response regulator RpfG family c-di-GMP phosphodiesterase|uniref:HD domain-containing phosphohydrolase n=1 Tax=Flavobacterium sp. TaxID=239 RepID=UPI0037A53811
MNQTKILLVDDQPISLLYLKKTLSRLADMDITTCNDAKEALNLFPHEQWDLIVADYQMPGMNGLDFVRRFRQIQGSEETPILMVTASTDPNVKYQLLDLGIVDFLQKPADASEIIARARNLISLHKATVSLKNHNQELKKGVQEMTKVLAEREQESLIVLARAAESRDPQTGSHLLRMASYSKIIALALGLSEDEAEEIYLAAPMHDVGKIGIPDRILLKNGKLTSDEWLEMKRHTNYGYDILRSSATPILKLGGVIALNHHEAWNGSGYPNGKKGHEIPLCARIVAVADVFDALMSPRPYKEAWSLDEALNELTNISGVRLDSECVTAFMQSIDSVKQIMTNYVDV